MGDGERVAISVRVDSLEPSRVEIILFGHDTLFGKKISPARAREVAASLVRAADDVDRARGVAGPDAMPESRL